MKALLAGFFTWSERFDSAGMVFSAPFGRDNIALMFLYNKRITDWGRGFKPLKAAKMG
jgi:hypothetical protein